MSTYFWAYLSSRGREETKVTMKTQKRASGRSDKEHLPLDPAASGWPWQIWSSTTIIRWWSCERLQQPRLGHTGLQLQESKCCWFGSRGIAVSACKSNKTQSASFAIKAMHQNNNTDICTHTHIYQHCKPQLPVNERKPKIILTQLLHWRILYQVILVSDTPWLHVSASKQRFPRQLQTLSILNTTWRDFRNVNICINNNAETASGKDEA
jgi:hypothetical protein